MTSKTRMKKRKKKKIKTKQKNYLPQDLIFAEILPRLPVKSLLRFKRVCKSWNALISSTHFAKHHFDHTTGTQSYKAVCFQRPKGFTIIRCKDIESVNMDCSYPKYYQPLFSKFLCSKICNHKAELMGSCNGLICFNDYEDGGYRFYVLNPATGVVEFQYLGLAEPVFGRVYLGFGYVASKDDYKIVVVRMFSDSITVYVYSMRMRGGWTETEMGLNELNLASYCYMRESLAGVLLDETLHWVTTDKRIVGFDLRDETFKIALQVPSVLERLLPSLNCPLSFFLTAMEGCLCAWVEHENGLVEAWMMKKYGVLDSWTKLFEINVEKLTDGDSCLQIVDMLDSRKVLMLTYAWGLRVIDLSCRQRKFVNVAGTRGAVKYVESLISPLCIGSEQKDS